MPKVIFWPYAEDSAEAPYVKLAWTPSVSPGVIQYNLYRSTTSGGPYTPIGSVVSSQSSAKDGIVSRGTTYYYVATSFDGSQESIHSNEASALVS